MSEKNHSLVSIKTINSAKPIVGAVQKVLNQIVIFKAAGPQPITLTFSDIESVNGSSNNYFARLLQKASQTLHRAFRKD